MSGIFSQEGKLSLILGRVGDLILLNLLTILCSIPVVTFGAAVSALYYCVLKIQQGEEGSLGRMYFSAFRDNLQKSSVIGIAGLVCAGLIWLDLRLFAGYTVQAAAVYRGILLVLLALVILFTLFCLVTAGWFENTLRNTVKNGVLFCLIHPLMSLAVGALTIAPVFLVMLSFRLLFIVFLLGIAVPAYLNGLYFRKLFANVA